MAQYNAGAQYSAGARSYTDWRPQYNAGADSYTHQLN
jgi:hypothetical protein